MAAKWSDMCGIVGYIGHRSAQPLLQSALSKMEYRGYDSCGIAVAGSRMMVQKDAGRMVDLAASSELLAGNIGIGHTRWASCGLPTRDNAHPHLDCSGNIAAVHNGNITNYLTLKSRLESRGHIFQSSTDSEVIVHLIEEYYSGDLVAALGRTVDELEGSFAVVVLRQGENRLAAARRGSALVIGLGDGENWLASDVTAFSEYTGRVIYLDDGDLAVVDSETAAVYRDGHLIDPVTKHIEWSPERTGKGGYEHYMLKEIHEQPRVLRENTGNWLAAGLTPGLSKLWHSQASPPLILGCGSSYYAGLVTKYFMEELLGRTVRVEMASEFSHQTSLSASGRLVIGLTQSGETADTLAALERMRKSGAGILAVTNVSGSSVTRLAEQTIFMGAGPEISVAATKTFTAQLGSLFALTLSLAGLERRRRDQLALALKELPALVQRVLDDSEDIEDAAQWLAGHRNVICIGRGAQYPVALEAALKLKEVAYIHSEGCAAGELKHGPLALLNLRDTGHCCFRS